jgi:hypothetical protein
MGQLVPLHRGAAEAAGTGGVGVGDAAAERWGLEVGSSGPVA